MIRFAKCLFNKDIFKQKSNSTYEISILSISCAILVISQLSIAFLPNVELVTLLIIIYSLNFKRKALYVIYAFILIEGIIFGFSLWWFAYLYIWLILFYLTCIFKDINYPLFWALMAAAFGMMFGTFSSIPYLLIGGFNAAFAYIIAGLPFDFIHCFSNFVIVLFLFKPLNSICSKINICNFKKLD